jgi:isoquinoline 1-oxidoreductase beta subunit
MGQGILTAAGMLVAEELDADWSMTTVQHAPLDFEFGSQVTQNSESVRIYWLMLRELGAAARAQLVRAAAERWTVKPATCTTSLGYVLHAQSGRRAAYGELAEAAARLPVVDNVQLKNPSDFRLVSRGAARIDITPMLDGSLRYTADVALPGLLTATVLHSPMIGGKVAAIDDKTARASPGVKATVNLQTAVAVVADNFWAAQQGLQRLEVKWTAPARAAMDEGAMRALLRSACRQRGAVAVDAGNVDVALSSGAAITDLEYSIPCHAHATMETMTCVADVRPGSCEVWAPTQSPWEAYGVAFHEGLSTVDRFRERLSRKLSGKAGERVKVHSMPVGGGFGRRLQQDFVREAVLISKAVAAPIKLIWTREEDMRNDFYRPASHHRIQTALDARGRIAAWYHRMAGSGSGGHASDFPYECADVRVETSGHDLGIPTGPWRSTVHTPNAFARECCIDELAERAGRDPVEFRLSLLTRTPRLKQVLALAAERAGWSKPLPARRGRGVAIHPSKDSFVAQIAEISTTDDGLIRVHRVVCVVDCGIVINPDTVKAQMEGAIVFGLTACLKSAITVHDGRIAQSNFHDFALLRMNETPEIEVHLVESTEPPGGVGEAGVPPIAPAVINALFAATGKRVRQLPFPPQLPLPAVSAGITGR